MENKHSFLKGALCGALAMFIGGGAIFGGVSLGKNVAEKIRKNENNSIQSSESVLNAESKEKLKEIEKIIDEHYLRDTDTEDLEDGMYAGILAGLNDPYSTYYTEEETKELFETTSGEYIGIGAAMSQNLDTGIITVSRVYKDSPAEKAGMRSEDILYKVEGEEVTGEELDEVVADIKGEEGTEVHITVLRGEEKEEIELTAVRGKVEAQTVEFEMKEDQFCVSQCCRCLQPYNSKCCILHGSVLFLLCMRCMIGSDHIHDVIFQSFAKCFYICLAAKRRVHLKVSIILCNIVCRHNKVMRAYFCRHWESIFLCLSDHTHTVHSRTMA